MKPMIFKAVSSVLMLWLFSADNLFGATGSATFSVYYQRIVPLSTDCTVSPSAFIPFKPLLPSGATITSNVLTGVQWDDMATLSGGGGSLTLGGCNGSGSQSFINLKSSPAIARSDGSFDIDLFDKTDINTNDNQILFRGTQTVTYNVAAPLPPAISDTNADEQVCAMRYADDGCEEKQQVICWYVSAGCQECSRQGSPQASFGLANFNVKVEDTPIWHATAVGEPLALKMRFSNYGTPATNQTFGPKWSCNWNSSVTVLHAKTNRMVFPSGSIVLFTQTVANTYVPPAALEGTLVKTNNIFRYTQLDGWSWEYSQSGASTNLYLLSAVRDVWSNTVSVTYTNGDRIFRVQQTVPDTGRYLEFAYNGTNSQALTVSTEPAALTNASFSYSASGWLTNVVDMGGHSYAYEYTNGFLAKVRKGAVERMGVIYSSLPNTWTSNTSYWVQLTDAGGFTNKYTWLYGLVQEDVSRGNEQQVKFYNISTAGSRGRVLTGSMGDGNQEQFQYNSQGRVTNRVDRNGNTWRQSYNAQNRLLTLTDPLTNKTTNVYANGVDLLYVQQPSGPAQRVFTYVTNKHAVATESNALGRVITNSYNALGLVTNTSDGRVTNSFVYNGEGRLVAHLRNGELMVTNQYDAFGRLNWTRDAAGLEVWRNYDGLNRLKTELFSNNGVLSTNQISYDCCSIDQIVDRDGNPWNFQFNDVGEMEWVGTPTGLTNFYSYGIARRPLVVSNALQWTKRQYTPESWLSKVEYPTNRTYDPGYHAENSWYDGEGRLTKWQNAAGAYFSNQYDKVGNLLRAFIPVGSNLAYGVEQYIQAETNSYDALDRKWRSQDIRGLVTSNSFNALGQVLKTWYPDASTEEWTYNQWGQPLTYKDRVGGVVSNFYDAQGRLWRQADARQFNTYLVYTNADLVAVVSNDAGQVWRFAYDAERQVQQIIHPDPNLVETFAYSPMGNVTQHVAGGVVRTMTYDVYRNRLTTHVSGQLVESNRYDQLGQLLLQKDADGLVISNAWDSWGMLKSRQWPNSSQELYQYNTRNLTNRLLRTGAPQSYVPDPLGRIVQWSAADSYYPDFAYMNTAITRYAYLSNSINQLQYLWDGNNNCTTWAYDLYGNPTNQVYANNTSNRFMFDRLNRVTNKLDAANVTTRDAYDTSGNLKTVSPGSDAGISLDYDGLDRLTNLVDGVGTTRWTYDAMDRLRSENGPFGSAVSADYDTLGRLTNLTFAGRAWSYQYDGLGRATNLVAPEGTYRLGYLQQGRRKVSLQYPNGQLMSMGYDSGILMTNLALTRSGDNLIRSRYEYTVDGLIQSNLTYETTATYSSATMGYGYCPGTRQLWRFMRETGDTGMRAYDPAGNAFRVSELGLTVTNIFNNLNQTTTGLCNQAQIAVSGMVNYNAGTVTVNGAVAKRSGLMYEATNVTLNVGTNIISAVFRGPAFTNSGAVATSITTVVMAGTNIFGYDANGNLTNDANFTYRYDALNRLTNVLRRTNGVSILANRYDGLGRRVEAVRDGTNVERYVYVPGTFLVLAVLDGSNNVKQTFTRGPDLSGTLDGAGGIGGVLAQTTGSNTTFLHSDVSGNIAFASDASGALVGTNRYTPFGSLVTRLGAYEGRYMFSSKEWEPSVGLYYYGYRFYSPQQGRWLSRDPLGEQADPLHNLYRFVGNNPLNAVDPDGLEIWPTQNVRFLGTTANAFEGPYDYLLTDSLWEAPMVQLYNVAPLMLNAVEWGRDTINEVSGSPYTAEALDAFMFLHAAELVNLGRAVGETLGRIRSSRCPAAAESGVASDDLVDLYHHTSSKGGLGINQTGVLDGSKTPGLWRPWKTGDVYLSTKPELSPFDRFLYGLPKSKTEAVVPVRLPSSKVINRPFGIRIHEGPITLGPPQ